MCLIGVVLNCPDWFNQAAALLNHGFENWQMITMIEKDEIIRQIPVENGIRESVSVRAKVDVAAPVGIHSWPDLLIDLPVSLPAGVEKGAEIGTASLMDGGEILVTVPLYAGESVPEKTFRDDLARLFTAWPCGT